MRQFRRGVAGNGERQFLARHAAAVVGNLNQRPPAFADPHLDLLRPGIDGVFDQFLGRRSRPLDDLSRRNAIDHAIRKNADFHDRPCCKYSRANALPLSTAG